MQPILTFIVSSDGSKMEVRLDAKVDPLVAVGLLEQAKQEVLKEVKNRAPINLNVPLLSPKKF